MLLTQQRPGTRIARINYIRPMADAVRGRFDWIICGIRNDQMSVSLSSRYASACVAMYVNAGSTAVGGQCARRWFGVAEGMKCAQIVGFSVRVFNAL